jgi:hypothetical protein
MLGSSAKRYKYRKQATITKTSAKSRNRSKISMVERPIKKADRQPKPEDNDGNQAKESDNRRSDRSGGKESREKRGKRDSRKEEVKAPVNLALMRGPKPTKPKPEAIAEEVAVAEAATVETVEVTEEA